MNAGQLQACVEVACPRFSPMESIVFGSELASLVDVLVGGVQKNDRSLLGAWG